MKLHFFHHCPVEFFVTTWRDPQRSRSQRLCESQSLWLKPKAGSAYTSSYSERRAWGHNFKISEILGSQKRCPWTIKSFTKERDLELSSWTLYLCSITEGKGEKEKKERAKKNGNQAEGNLSRNALSPETEWQPWWTPQQRQTWGSCSASMAHTPVSLPSPEQLTPEFLSYYFFWPQAYSSCLPSSSHPHFTSLSLPTWLFSLSPLSFKPPPRVLQ